MRPVRRSWVLRDSEMIDQRGRFTNSPGRKQWRLLKRTQRPRRTLCYIVRSIDNVRCNVVSRTGKSSDLFGVRKKKKRTEKRNTTHLYRFKSTIFFPRIFLKNNTNPLVFVNVENRRVKRRRKRSRFTSFVKMHIGT